MKKWLKKAGVFFLAGGIVYAGLYGYNKPAIVQAPSIPIKKPTHIFYTDIDGVQYTSKKNDDLVIGFDNQTLEYFVRDPQGNFLKFDQMKEEQINQIELEKNSQLEAIILKSGKGIKNIQDKFKRARDYLEKPDTPPIKKETPQQKQTLGYFSRCQSV
ncbi:MAG: hypothetical protein AABX16_01490 [Nanoarchaeota archaeon]